MTSSINTNTLNWAKKNNIPAYFLESTDSTNAWAKKDFKTQNAIFLADYQTQGRGRNTNSWQNSKPGDQLLSTWCMQTKNPISVLFPIRAGWAIYDALQTSWPNVNFSLKAPNDIFISSSKLSGVLIEVISADHTQIFVGLGINVFSAPQDLDRKTAALADHTEITTSQWEHFCLKFHADLIHALSVTDNMLSVNEQAFIASALKKHGDNKFESIQPDGSLIFSDGRIMHWRDL